MKLYYAKGTCSLAARIVIHEAGLTATYESVDIRSKKMHDGTDFFQVNPKGAVPVLVTDKGEIVTENIAILQFLAEQAPAKKLLPETGHFSRYRVLEWLGYLASDVHKSFAVFFSPVVSDEVKRSVFVPLVRKKLDFIEAAMQKQEGESYLMGSQFTLPDPYLFVMLSWLSHIKMTVNDWPSLASYYHLVSERESVKQALQEEKLQS